MGTGVSVKTANRRLCALSNGHDGRICKVRLGKQENLLRRQYGQVSNRNTAHTSILVQIREVAASHGTRDLQKGGGRQATAAIKLHPVGSKKERHVQENLAENTWQSSLQSLTRNISTRMSKVTASGASTALYALRVPS